MINKICGEQQCTGCSACMSVCPRLCIQMIPDKEGFLRPIINNNLCIGCNRCVQVCPINCQSNDDIMKQPLTFAARHRDINVIEQSSSGGAFTAFANYILSKNGIVFGAGFDENFDVVHKACTTVEDIDELRRSKYVQSIIGNTFIKVKEALLDGRKVLFCGTPCQVSGLKSFLGKEYDSLYTIDFICHGVPSPKAWRKYLDYRESSQGSSIESINFRSKEKSWKSYSLRILFKNKSYYSQDVTQDLYLRSFIMNLTLRLSCYDCVFKTFHRVSDITVADFWGFDDHICAEWNNDTGISCVMTHSIKGKKLLDSVNDVLDCFPVQFEYAIKNNQSMMNSVKKPALRKSFLKDLDKKDFKKVYDKYCSSKVLSKIRRKIASMVR